MVKSISIVVVYSKVDPKDEVETEIRYMKFFRASLSLDRETI